MVPFKCDVHGWMNAYVGVLDHPYFAVTDKDGKFELKSLPPGTYTIEAWHEKLGTHDAERDAGAEGKQGNQLHLQGAGWRHGDRLTIRQAQGLGLTRPRRCSTGSRRSSPAARCCSCSRAASSRAPARDSRSRTGRPPTAGTCSRSRRRSGSAASSTSTAIG